MAPIPLPASSQRPISVHAFYWMGEAGIFGPWVEPDHYKPEDQHRYEPVSVIRRHTP
jgi:hypothetical protein